MENYKRLLKYKSFNHDASDIKILRLFTNNKQFIVTVTREDDDLLGVETFDTFAEAEFRLFKILYSRQFKNVEMNDGFDDEHLHEYIKMYKGYTALALRDMVLQYRVETFNEKAMDVWDFLESED